VRSTVRRRDDVGSSTRNLARGQHLARKGWSFLRRECREPESVISAAFSSSDATKCVVQHCLVSRRMHHAYSKRVLSLDARFVARIRRRVTVSIASNGAFLDLSSRVPTRAEQFGERRSGFARELSIESPIVSRLPAHRVQRYRCTDQGARTRNKRTRTRIVAICTCLCIRDTTSGRSPSNADVTMFRNDIERSLISFLHNRLFFSHFCLVPRRINCSRRNYRGVSRENYAERVKE